MWCIFRPDGSSFSPDNPWRIQPRTTEAQDRAEIMRLAAKRGWDVTLPEPFDAIEVLWLAWRATPNVGSDALRQAICNTAGPDALDALCAAIEANHRGERA